MPTTLTFDEALAVLRISRATLYKLLKRGELPARQIGRQWRFDPATLSAFLCVSGGQGGSRFEEPREAA